MRTSPQANEDEQRARALVCVAKNVDDPEQALGIMEMLGLIDGKGEFVAADEMTMHLNNPRRRGIGCWLS